MVETIRVSLKENVWTNWMNRCRKVIMPDHGSSIDISCASEKKKLWDKVQLCKPFCSLGFAQELLERLVLN